MIRNDGREIPMITLKSQREINHMHEAGKLLAACHKEIAKIIKPGMSTLTIDQFVENYLKKNGATPEQKGIRVTNMRHAPLLTMKYVMVIPANLL